MLRPQTRDQIIAAASSIDPKAAFYLKGTGDSALACATPIYTSFIDDNGQEVSLKLASDGRYAAGYVRVSTIRQKRDGWSIPDQVSRIVDYCLQRRLAFRIFSDSTLSGKLPTDDKNLIQQMYTANARRYGDAYRAVFLSDTQRRNMSPTKVAHMEAWLADMMEQITKGNKGEGLADDMDRDTDEPRPHRGKKRRNEDYRPGLTELMRAIKDNRIYLLAISDVTRLARSQALQVILTDTLFHYGVQVVGLIETTDFINDKTNLGNQITASVLSLIAEYKLREVSVGALRGIAERLESGLPHGSLPFWCRKGPEGEILLDERGKNTIQTIVRLYLEGSPEGGEPLSFLGICHYLNTRIEQYPPPGVSGNRKRLTDWTWVTIKYLLKNENIAGEQHSFGQVWKVLPPVIDQATWERLKTRVKKRSEERGIHLRTDHLLAYLIRCQCGCTMLWAPHMSGKRYYTCDLRRRGRVTEGELHAKIDADSIEGFFDSLIREFPHFLLNPHRESPERQMLTSDITRLRSEQIILDRELPQAVITARERALADLRKVGRDTSDEVVELLVGTDATVKTKRQQLQEIEYEIEQREHLLRSILPSDQIGLTEERIQQWDNLSQAQKGALLRRLISSIIVERKERESRILIQLNNYFRETLPPIQLKMKVHGQGFTITPPTVREWIASW